MQKMSRKILIFEYAYSGEVEIHPNDAWFLTYINFPGIIHPSQLRVGQTAKTFTLKGEPVKISCKSMPRQDLNLQRPH